MPSDNLITLTTITIPTPQPYDSKDDQRQRENFFYVLNQMLVQMQSDGETITISPSTSQTVNVDLTDLIDAVRDLAFTGGDINIPTLGVRLHATGKTLSVSQI